MRLLINLTSFSILIGTIRYVTAFTAFTAYQEAVFSVQGQSTNDRVRNVASLLPKQIKSVMDFQKSFYRKLEEKLERESHEAAIHFQVDFWDLDKVIFENEEKNRTKRNAIDFENEVILTQWSQWGECNATDCGVAGLSSRTRACFIDDFFSNDPARCKAALLQTRDCELDCEGSGENILSHIRSGWAMWSRWSPCSETCGTGIQVRIRSCLEDSFGIRSCSGHRRELRICRTGGKCPANWLPWTPWTRCSVTCGRGGKQTRSRSCWGKRVNATKDPSNPFNNFSTLMGFLDASHCETARQNRSETRSCRSTPECFLNWSSWQSWTTCSSTCGRGISSRGRQCIGKAFTERGKCRGSDAEFRYCFTPPCWSRWSQFGPCNKKDNTRTRTRRCLKATPFVVSKFHFCRGRRKDTASCPVWSAWTGFTTCSHTCDGGRKVRNRRCVRGRCTGSSYDVVSCGTQRCAFWSKWSEFSCCSATCGNGTMERVRGCEFGEAGIATGCQGSTSQVEKCYRNECGTPNVSPFSLFECGIRDDMMVQTKSDTSIALRIFGGRIPSRHGWPWQASWQHKAGFFFPWNHLCGGTVIAHQWVMTSAHCIKQTIYNINLERPSDNWSVVLGMHRLFEDGVRYFAKRIYVHSDYAYDAVTVADVALIKLKRSIAFNERIRPVCLSSISQPKPGLRCFVTGWGYRGSKNNGSLSETLLEAEVPIISFEQCTQLGPRYASLNRSHHLCAGNSPTETADTCMGDSGGPLSCKDTNGRWYLAGTTSFGFYRCGRPGHAGIYSPTPSYESWIRKVVQTNDVEVC